MSRLWKKQSLCALGVWWFAAAAQAQAQEDTVRRELIDRAGAARDRGDHTTALGLLRQAAARRMSPSLQVFLAQEERETHDLLAALRDARQALAEVTSNTTLNNRDYLLGECGGLITRLEADTARVTIEVPAAAPGDTRVRLNDTEVDAATWNRPVDVLPGTVRVEVTATGRTPYRESVSLRAGQSQIVRATLRVIAPVATPVTPVATPPVDTRRVTTSTPDPISPPVEAPATHGPGAGPWVLMGVGALSFAMVGVFYGLRESATGDAYRDCIAPQGDCLVHTEAQRADGQSAQDRALTFTVLTDVAWGVGAAAAVGGGLWWLLGRSSGERPATALWVAPHRDGLWIGVQGRL